MLDKKKHINEPDLFNQQVRQKLENHRMPVDADWWREIELGIQSTKKKKTTKYIWIGGAVAAVATLVILLLSTPTNSPSTQMATVEKIEIDNSASTNTIIAIAENDIEDRIEEQTTNNSTFFNNNGKKYSTKKESKQSQTTPQAIATDTNTKTVTEDNEPTLIEKEEEKSADTKKEKNTDKDIFTLDYNESDRLITLNKSGRKNNKWMLAASFGSGGSKYSNKSFPDYTHLASNPNNPPPETPGSGSEGENDETEIKMEHSLPLSFGFSLRKDLSKRFAIETGLTYTHLSTRFKISNNDTYSGKQELNYLGIPLNLIVYLWNSSNWNIYLSGGVMVEKGIYYAYNEEAHSKNTIDSYKDNGMMSGVQWSANASLGIAYTLHQDWDIYVEPRISHYLDNNQPVSIRTEKPSIVSVGSGIRYKF